MLLRFNTILWIVAVSLQSSLAMGATANAKGRCTDPKTNEAAISHDVVGNIAGVRKLLCLPVSNFERHTEAGEFIYKVAFENIPTKYFRVIIEDQAVSTELDYSFQFVNALGERNCDVSEDGRDRCDFTRQDVLDLPGRIFYTPIIFSTSGYLLVRTKTDLEGVPIYINGYSRGEGGKKIQSITTPNQIMEFDELMASKIWQHPNFLAWRKDAVIAASDSVAVVLFEKFGVPTVCTGFLVSEDILVTNEHCVSSNLMCGSASIRFGGRRISPNARVSRSREYRCKSVSASRDSDISLLQVSGKPGARFGHARISRMGVISNEEQLLLVHFPDNDDLHKKFSLLDCRQQKIRDGIVPTIEFAHHCDTQGGSSGSPIFNAKLQVVGVHHAGFATSDKDSSRDVCDDLSPINLGDCAVNNTAIKASALLKVLANEGVDSIILE